MYHCNFYEYYEYTHNIMSYTLAALSIPSDDLTHAYVLTSILLKFVFKHCEYNLYAFLTKSCEESAGANEMGASKQVGKK